MRWLTGLTVVLALAVIVSTHNVQKRQARRPQRRKPSSSTSADDVVDPTPPGKRVVCYYSNWSVYRRGLAKFTPQNINPYLCTHLVYAFGGLTDDFEITVSDDFQDIEKGGYAQFAALKQYNRNLRTLLAIGGWNEGSARFSELVSLPDARKVLVDSSIRHLRRYNFDGLDLDWEYPASRAGSAPEDKPNYALLVQELRAAFEEEALKSGKPRLLLTMAVPAGQRYIDDGYDIPTLNANLDFFNMLTYDYSTSVDPSVRHHSPLLALPGTSEYEDAYQLNVEWTVSYYVQQGADKEKLVVGIPTYGRSFTLADQAFNEMGSAANGAAKAGNYTKEEGYMAFYEVCEAMSVAGWQAKKPFPRSVGPYAYKDDQWVGYDDERMVATKAEYVRDTGLGGIMFWTLDSDDFRGLCKGEPYLLVEAGKMALLGAARLDATNTLDERLPAKTQLPSTAAPPTTPSYTPAFQCKREGTYPNPDNCHQYFRCLASGQLGIVAHTFNCPTGLVFSRTVDGCDFPDRTKCVENVNRGGAAETLTTTTPIPTTTPFPPFDYDYYYYDEEEYADAATPGAAGAVSPGAAGGGEVVAKLGPEASLARPPSRNSGGAQFTRPAIRGEEQRAQEGETPAGGRGKNRPQYTAITRDRPNPDAVEDAPVGDAAAPGGQNGRRPQYTSIARDRPVTPVADYEDAFVGVTPSHQLNYVTIERQRSAHSEDLQGEVDSATQPGLQYVTLRRAGSRGSTTEAPGDPSSLGEGQSSGVVLINSDSFRQRPEQVDTTTEPTSTTATTTTTTTPRPARVVVPSVLLEPVTTRVVNRLNLDPRKSNRIRPAENDAETSENVHTVPRRRSTTTTTTTTESLPATYYVEEEILPVDNSADDYYLYDDTNVDGPDVPSAVESSLASPVSETTHHSPKESLAFRTTVAADADAEVAPPAAEATDAGNDLLEKEMSATDTEELTEKEISGTVTEATTPTTQRTTVSLLAEFPAFTSTTEAAVMSDGIAADDIAREAIDDSRLETLDETQDETPAERDDDALVKTPVEISSISEVAVETSQLIETPVEISNVHKTPVEASIIPDEVIDEGTAVGISRPPEGSKRRVPQLPPRTRRPDTSVPSATDNRPETERRRPQPPERRTPSRFTPTRPKTDSVDSSIAETTTRRSTFQRPTPRDESNATNRPRPTVIQSRFRPRNQNEDSANADAVTVQPPAGESNRNRFQSRPTSENRFRLNPVAVTEESPVTPSRPRRPRPTSADGPRTRPNNRIKFVGREQDTTEETPEATESILEIRRDEEVESEPPVTPSLFDVLFGDNRDIASTASHPVEHKILDTEASVEQVQENSFTESVQIITEKPFNIEDFIVSPKSTLRDLIDDITTTSTTTTTITVPSTTTTSTPTVTTTRPLPATLFIEDALTIKPIITRSPPRLPEPLPTSTPRLPVTRRGGRPPKPRSSTARPSSQIPDYVYDYFYNDDDSGALGGTLGELAELTEKALLLPGGNVQCYDTGYFAHPDSCKKFISCSKTVRGAVRGWVYTCPQQLVFDPVGGMCNWAEAVDCKAPIV